MHHIFFDKQSYNFLGEIFTEHIKKTELYYFQRKQNFNIKITLPIPILGHWLIFQTIQLITINLYFYTEHKNVYFYTFFKKETYLL